MYSITVTKWQRPPCCANLVGIWVTQVLIDTFVQKGRVTPICYKKPDKGGQVAVSGSDLFDLPDAEITEMSDSKSEAYIQKSGRSDNTAQYYDNITGSAPATVVDPMESVGAETKKESVADKAGHSAGSLRGFRRDDTAKGFLFFVHEPIQRDGATARSQASKTT